MNWVAGLLAFIIFWVPCILIIWQIDKKNRRADAEYAEKLRKIYEDGYY